MLPSIFQINSMKASSVTTESPTQAKFRGFIGKNVSRLGRLGGWVFVIYSLNNTGIY